MIVAIPKENHPDEARVALTPAAVGACQKLGLEVRVEAGAGAQAGFNDTDYEAKGAAIVQDRGELFHAAGIIAQVRSYPADPEHGRHDLEHLLREGHIVVGHAEPLTAPEAIEAMNQRGVTLMAMELIPRITRAQAMDALSSQANLGGYMAVLLAATHMPKIMPMMMTAAGTIKPAKVFVIGAGVAGLQAIATAKRLGAVVSATDVRPATKEQVESLGGKFVMVEEAMAEGEGGYARELTPEQKEKQQQLVAQVVADSDVVITTAAIPGRKAPVLVSEQMVQSMKPRSVIVDLAAERGGNCALTEPGQTVEQHGVTIVGRFNLPGLVPQDASVMYANNVAKLLAEFVGEGRAEFDMDNEVIAGVVVCHGKRIIHPRVCEAMGLEPPQAEPAPEPASADQPAEPAASGESPDDTEGSGQ